MFYKQSLQCFYEIQIFKNINSYNYVKKGGGAGSELKNELKGTVSVISSDPLCKDGNIVPF